jgi:hypothetical protein
MVHKPSDRRIACSRHRDALESWWIEGLVENIYNEALVRLTGAQSYGAKEKVSSSISWRAVDGG